MTEREPQLAQERHAGKRLKGADKNGRILPRPSLHKRGNKMARKRTPCEWCGSEQIFRLNEGCRNADATVEIYPDNGFIGFTVQGMNDENELVAEESMDLPLNFCPNCGRKLR